MADGSGFGEEPDLAEGADSSEEEGSGDGVSSVSRASVTARPWVVALDEASPPSRGLPAESLPDEALDDELGEPLGERAGGRLRGGLGRRPRRSSTGRKYSWAVVPTCSRACFSFVPLGMLTMMFSVPWV